MAFPQERPLSMKLTTDTVMQSFMIPALGGQSLRDAGDGYTTEFESLTEPAILRG